MNLHVTGALFFSCCCLANLVVLGLGWIPEGWSLWMCHFPGLSWFMVIKPARQTGLSASVGVVVVVISGSLLCMRIRGRRFGWSFVLLCICFIRALLSCTST